LKTKVPEFYSCFKKYEEVLDNHKRLTFNRMINLALQNLQEKKDVLSNVEYLIVDEYQDINRAQEKLIKLIGEKASIFIVGDPRQTIYQWRGADEKCFEDFSVHYEDVETIPITENRRSGRHIIEVANRFSDTFETKHDHLDPVRKEESAVFIVELADNTHEAKWIAEQIENYVNSGKCSYGDIGILFRSVSTSAPPFIDIFRERRIPFIVGGKVGLFRRSEIQTVGKLFAWLYEKGFWYESQWDREKKEDGEELLYSALEDWNSGVPGCRLHDEIIKQLESWKKKVLDSKCESFTKVYHDLLVLLNYLNLNPEDSNDAVVMANLGRFSSLLTDFESANMLGGRQRNWERDLKNLCWYMNSYATGAYEEQAGDDIRGVDAVQLMTVHQAKGLEWPLVFVPAMNNRRFPSSMIGKAQKWLIPRDMFDADKYEGDIESEKKLFYVALTRAKDILVVSYFGKLNGRGVKESVFVSQGLQNPKMKRLSSQDELPMHDIMESELSDEILTYTTSEIILYQKCPYFYKLNQIWGYEPGFKERIGYGNTLHFCLQQAADMITNEGYSPISAISTAVDKNFYMPFVNKVQGEKIKEAAKRKLISYVKKYETDMHNIQEVEARIEFPLQNATITGKIDVIIHDGDRLEVRDYKTSDSVITEAESAMQVQMYSIGLKMLGENVTKGSIAYLSDAKVSVVEVDNSRLEETKKQVEKHIEGIKSGDFKPCTGEFCGTCELTKVCRWDK
jgi:DNA helicase-2/ATP-dependent DNA helicase PcrA